MTFGVICILSVVCIIVLIFLFCMTRSWVRETTQQEGNDALSAVSECKPLRHSHVHTTVALVPMVHLNFPNFGNAGMRRISG